MWKWFVILATVVVVLTPSVVMAATEQDVTVTATPGYGITSFSIDYISDTRLDLSWTTAPEVVNVMVRAKYGEDLDEIPDEDTEPSDGYEVYYGSGSSVSDTSMDFDQNPGMLYYKIWGQKADGKWYVGSQSDSEESAVVTLLALFLFCGLLSFLSHRSPYSFLRWIAGFAWFGIMIYWIQNPPSQITAGDATHVAVMLVLMALGIAFLLLGLTSRKGESETVDEVEEKVTRRSVGGFSDQSDYKLRVRQAAGRKTRRRR